MALASGVPLVVAGAREDKPEVAARVAWSGSAVNLRAERPKPDLIAEAVSNVLTKPSYGDNARRLAEAISRTTLCTPWIRFLNSSANAPTVSAAPPNDRRPRRATRPPRPFPPNGD
jgi:hypothetical protein